jgi:acetolactate synthase small subunit
MSTVHALVPNRPGILDSTAALMHRRGLRLNSIAISGSHRPAWARLTMHVHDDDVSAVLAQLERHILGERVPEATRGSPGNEMGDSYRWQADGARGEDAA